MNIWYIKLLLVFVCLVLSACSEDDSSAANLNTKTKQQAVIQVAAAPSLPSNTIFSDKLESLEEVQEILEQDWTKNGLMFTDGRDESCKVDSDYSLYVRYVTHYPSNPKGHPTFAYTDVKVPPISELEVRRRTPEISEVVYRDDMKWERHHQKIWWWGVDEKWKKSRQEELDGLMEEFDELQAAGQNVEALRFYQNQMEPIQNNMISNPQKGLNELVHDRIEVNLQPPAKSFRFDNHEKRGMLFESTKRLGTRELESWAKKLDRSGQESLGSTLEEAFKPLGDFGEELRESGTRTILGYTCTIQSSSRWNADVCSYDMGGSRDLMLWMRMDKAVKEAVYIQRNPCVSDSLFVPPSDVEFGQYRNLFE